MSKEILITGSNSKIAKHLVKLLPKEKTIKTINSKNFALDNLYEIKNNYKYFKKFDTMIFFHSKVGTDRINFQNIEEITKAIHVNLLSQIYLSEICLKNHKNAKILFMGSESGLKGSYDIVYALMKSSIHKYVEERKILHKNQKILCLAPSTIIDSNFTKNRIDQKNVKNSLKNNPKKRGLFSKEIAEIILEIVFDKKFDYLTNTVIHLNGGKFARM